ncbi:MAG: hypothetical protein P8179_13315 [Candidatus Thiodiazotropha sp.]|jgi:hypothetical protein
MTECQHEYGSVKDSKSDILKVSCRTTYLEATFSGIDELKK